MNDFCGFTRISATKVHLLFETSKPQSAEKSIDYELLVATPHNAPSFCHDSMGNTRTVYLPRVMVPVS